MYTLEIGPKWGLEHHGGGRLVLVYAQKVIPYEEASIDRSVKQVASDVGGASIELPPHDDLEEA
jgi:hypothetical protein